MGKIVGHLDFADVEHRSNLLPWQERGLQYTRTGYGGKIPTQWQVKRDGRWQRVYVAQYGNAGTAYIVSGDDWIVMVGEPTRKNPAGKRASKGFPPSAPVPLSVAAKATLRREFPEWSDEDLEDVARATRPGCYLGTVARKVQKRMKELAQTRSNPGGRHQRERGTRSGRSYYVDRGEEARRHAAWDRDLAGRELAESRQPVKTDWDRSAATGARQRLDRLKGKHAGYLATARQQRPSLPNPVRNPARDKRVPGGQITDWGDFVTGQVNGIELLVNQYDEQDRKQKVWYWRSYGSKNNKKPLAMGSRTSKKAALDTVVAVLQDFEASPVGAAAEDDAPMSTAAKVGIFAALGGIVWIVSRKK